MGQIDAQHFITGFTPWHITFGTYGTRLHGETRPTVDKAHNQIGTAFVSQNSIRQECARDRMKFPPRYLTIEQRLFVEAALPAICQRGG